MSFPFVAPLHRARAIGLAFALLVVPAASGAAQQIEPSIADWPQHLGPTRNAVAGGPLVASSWPDDGPRRLWRRTVGAGYSGPVVVDGRLVLFHRVEDREMVESLDAATGEVQWSAQYPTAYRDDFGFGDGPRGTPTVAGGRVYTSGAEGVLQALDLATGERLWSVDTHARFAVAKGFFGAAGSPLVVDGRVMLNVGGTDGAGIVAFDADTGAVLWTATDDEAGYAAPITADIGGVPRALFFTRTGLVDIDPVNGKVRSAFRWRSRSRASVNAASPIVVDERVLLSASYGTGAVLLQLEGAAFLPVWSSDEALSAHYATPVHHDGIVYGFDGALHLGPPSLRAVELASGRVRWSVDAFGGGTIVRSGDRLLIQREDGVLVLAEATPEQYRPLAQTRILNSEVRAYPALAGGIWYARSTDELVALDLR